LRCLDHNRLQGPVIDEIPLNGVPRRQRIRAGGESH
jgi:hypothetical protein